MQLVQSYEQILERIDAIDPVAYAATRNRLDGAVTKLSPYITRGVITLPQIRDRLLARHTEKDCEKLLQELAWREYFQNVWWARGEDIFSDIRFTREDWRHHGHVLGLVDAATGIVAIDEVIKEFYETGYMHNHARMWVASLACNISKAHWHAMGQWLYYHLADGDLASNFLSWQWVAGTSVNKRYSVNQELINGCSESAQQGTYLDVPRDQVLEIELPTELTDHESLLLQTQYPKLDPVPTVTDQRVGLYTPWTLDPTWRADELQRQILVIDPAWFDRYPVSELVLDFIMRQGKTVMPELEFHIGAPSEIHGINETSGTFARSHQTNQDWPAALDEAPKLHTAVSGYYQSFFKYWEAVQASQS